VAEIGSLGNARYAQKTGAPGMPIPSPGVAPLLRFRLVLTNRLKLVVKRPIE
jgi:hypothetical protein